MIPSEQLAHDSAAAAATGVMDLIGEIFMDHERGDAWQFFYEHFRACLESYLIMHSRLSQRFLKPTEN